MFQFKGSLQSLVNFSPTPRTEAEGNYRRCVITPVDVIQNDNPTAKRDRDLVHLLRLNHHSHSLLYSGYKGFAFHNHIPHALGSAYLWGADEKQLHDIYELEGAELEPWKESPGEVTGGDWWRYLGDRDYQRAFLDFFEDELVRLGYDWKKVLMEYMLENESPLVNCLISGLAHPLIHFGYAIELNSREVAMEALTMAASCDNFLRKYVESEIPSPTDKSTSDPLELLRRVREDSRFDGIYHGPGPQDYKEIFRQREQLFVEYFDLLDMEKIELNTLMEALTKTAVLLLTTTHKPSDPQFDFFLCHTVSAAYALRTILPVLPAKHHIRLIRSHWLFTLFVYLTQMRPSIKPELLEEVDASSRGWDYVRDTVLRNTETHFMKALRVMRDSAKLYKADENFYLLAALKFGDEFQSWVGFENSKDTIDIKA